MRRRLLVCWHHVTPASLTQSSDGIQELHTVTKRSDTKLLQVLVRQARENRLVYVILAEIASYFARPRLRSQTTTSMTVPTIGSGAHHLPGLRGCPGWRWGSQGFAKRAEVL